MKVIEIRETGGPEVLELAERPIPEPGPGEVLVASEAAGVNFIDVYNRTGLYPNELPFIPGREGAGRVAATGDGVDRLTEGDLVAWAPVLGSYAEYTTIEAEKVVPVPEGITPETAAAAMLQGMTAHYLAFDIVDLGSGSTALVHAAAGGVGRLLVQLLVRLGVTVYGTAGSDAKREMALDAGATHVIPYREVDFREEIERLTDGKGVDVVYDSVGVDTFDRSLESLARRGTLVSFGQSSGPVPPFEIRRLSQGSLSLIRPSLGDYVATGQELTERANDLFDRISDGSLEIEIDSRFPLGDAADAHRRLEARKSAGKILLTMEGAR